MCHNGNARVKKRVKGQKYASQSIMLYTLNLHSAACRLYLNKPGKEKIVHSLLLLSIIPWYAGGASGKELTCQRKRGKRPRFNPWVGKVPWRKAWQSTPVFLPGESHGKRTLVGYSP